MINYKPLIISRTLPHLGGRERVVQSLLNYFKDNAGVTLVTPDKINGVVGINVIQYDENLEAWDDLISKLESYDFNVVHCHTFYLVDFAIKVSNHFKIPLIFTLHGVFFDYYGDKYNEIIKRIAENSTVFTTVSNQYKSMLEKFLGDGTDIECVSNGLIYKAYDEKNSKNFDSKEIVVAVPARLTKIKGLEYLIYSLPLLKSNIKIHVCSPAGREIAEETKFKVDLLSRVQTNNIYFHEFDNDQWLSFLNDVDIVLLPSLIEGQSLSLLEAMSQRKIVIATDVGGNPELISNKISGFLIEARSSEAISKSIEYISNLDDSAREQIKDNAMKTVIENFSFNKMIHGYISLYEKAILKKQKNPKDIQPVIVRNLDNPEFLVLKRLNKNTNVHEFRLVKGGIKKMEEPEDALIREINEETGIQEVDILTKLTSYSYSYFLKRVYVTHNVTTYLVKAISKENFYLINQAEEGGFDIDSVLWINEENILTTLTYPQEKELVREAIEYLNK